jgi:hypothetical protein
MWVFLAAAGATTFTLNCNVRTVAEDMTAAKRLSVPADPKTIVYRVDLDRLRWCNGDCKFTQPIVNVTAEEIRLQQDESQQSLSVTTLDRETGELLILVTPKDRSLALVTSGKCQVAPFTGMPEPKF